LYRLADEAARLFALLSCCFAAGTGSLLVGDKQLCSPHNANCAGAFERLEETQMT